MNLPDTDSPDRDSEDILLVTNYLREQASSAASQRELPHSGSIWWKAQLRARREAVERSLRPISIVEKLAWFVAAGTALFTTLPYWHLLRTVVLSWADRLH